MAVKTNMRKQLDEHPYYTTLLLLLYSAGVATFPSKSIAGLFGGGDMALLIVELLVRTVCSIIPFMLINDFGYSDIVNPKNTKVKALLFVLPCFIVSINNFPIVALVCKSAQIAESSVVKWILYSCTCLSIGLVEEVVFRGCIYKILREKLENNRKGLFLSVLISSALFGGMHLINLLNGFNPAVFLQISYSFLIGAMCAFALEKTNNLFIAVVLHGIFDMGGLLYDFHLIVGEVWNKQEIIVTAVIGVIVAVFVLYVLFKNDKKRKKKKKKKKKVKSATGR